MAYGDISSSRACLYKLYGLRECKVQKVTIIGQLSNSVDLVTAKDVIDFRLNNFSKLCVQANLWNGEIYNDCESGLAAEKLDDKEVKIGTCLRSDPLEHQVLTFTQWLYYLPNDSSNETKETTVQIKKSLCERIDGVWMTLY